MSSKADNLQQQCEALEVFYTKLSRDFYQDFQLKQIDDSLPASPANTILVVRKGAKQKTEQLFVEVKALIASALDTYLAYKNGWFSNQEFAEHSKQIIDKVSMEYEKTRYFFDSYKIIEE